ncbi:MAG: hypothetical protein KC910_15420 [Candidatus Eremiobacteraeota bacterium]|nr:hypothetical protein [Candidatus Eremiobacteraeota bacterium]
MYRLEEFRVICAWCHSIIQSPKCARGEVPESHGVCRGCAIKMGLPAHLLDRQSA